MAKNKVIVVHVHQRLPAPRRTQDDQHWITVHPHGEKPGQPILIEGSGGHYTIVGGAGGRMNGTVVKPGSMSGARPGTQEPSEAVKASIGAKQASEFANRPGAHFSAHAAAYKQHSTAATEHQRAGNMVGAAWHRQRSDEHLDKWQQGREADQKAREQAKMQAARDLSAKANKLSETANTEEEHRAAAAAHREAREALLNANTELGNSEVKNLVGQHQSNAIAHEFRAKKMAEERAAKEAAAARKEAKKSDTGRAAIEKKFANHTSQQVHEHFQEKWGLGFVNGTSKEHIKAHETAKAAYDKAYQEDFEKRHHQNGKGYANESEIMAAKWELEKLRSAAWDARQVISNNPAARVKSHTEADIDDGSAAAKQNKKLLGHMDAAMQALQDAGFDVKAAISKGKVNIVPGGTGKALGHAWQSRGGSAYFGVSAAKGMSDKTRAAYDDADKRRAALGKPKWTVSAGNPDDLIRATTVHELTHALGMQPHINSPGHLTAALNQALAEVEHHPDDVAKYGKFSGGNTNYLRLAWIKRNISEYAATNILETDAELCSYVTAPYYVRGTLPKVLEDHVDWLFNKRKE